LPLCQKIFSNKKRKVAPVTDPHFKYLSIFLGLLFITFTSTAQEIENLFRRIEGTNVILTYDLTGEPEQLFRIEIFSSHNNYSTKLVEVSGDVGENISPGRGKSVTWDAASELGNYNGDIELEIQGFIMPQFLEFTNITTGSSFKRGKTNTIFWKSNTTDPNIKLELYQSGQKISDFGNIPNNGSYNWSIPKDRKPGKNFNLVAISSQEQASSASFRIAPKIPIVLKILPIALIGGLTAIIVSSGGGKKSVIVVPPPDEKIENPKRPDGN